MVREYILFFIRPKGVLSLGWVDFEFLKPSTSWYGTTFFSHHCDVRYESDTIVQFEQP